MLGPCDKLSRRGGDTVTMVIKLPEDGASCSSYDEATHVRAERMQRLRRAAHEEVVQVPVKNVFPRSPTRREMDVVLTAMRGPTLLGDARLLAPQMDTLSHKTYLKVILKKLAKYQVVELNDDHHFVKNWTISAGPNLPAFYSRFATELDDRRNELVEATGMERYTGGGDE
jgi:hypothetical protein